jgi:membrane protein DedA with SNARE-associated domain
VESFIEFIKNWGYLAVFLGSTVEGESVILTASSMAALGHLNIYKIMIIAFVTTTVVDQLLFFLGIRYGAKIFARHPSFRQRVDRAFMLLHKYDTTFILTFRFIYGIRTISPIVIGASGVSPARFIPLNILAAFIWTCLSCGGGYLLGGTMLAVMTNIAEVQKYLIILIVSIALLGFGYNIWKRTRKNSL